MFFSQHFLTNQTGAQIKGKVPNSKKKQRPIKEIPVGEEHASTEAAQAKQKRQIPRYNTLRRILCSSPVFQIHFWSCSLSLTLYSQKKSNNSETPICKTQKQIWKFHHQRSNFYVLSHSILVPLSPPLHWSEKSADPPTALS